MTLILVNLLNKNYMKSLDFDPGESTTIDVKQERSAIQRSRSENIGGRRCRSEKSW